MRKVIITGVTGFFGSYLSNKLLSEGVIVYGVARNRKKMDEFKNYSNFIPIIVSFDEFLELPQIIKDRDVDVFYHFAWEGGYTSAIRDYKLQMRNASYAGDAIVAAKEIGCKKFVYSGTYNQFEIISILESDRVDPRWTCIYGAGKTAASIICKTLAFNLKIEYSAGLVPMPYGKYNYSRQLANVVIDSLNKGITPKLVEGNNYYDFVYIGDIVNAFVALGEKGVNQREYYVGHRKLKTFKEWITDIRNIIAPNIELKFGEYKDNQQIDYDKIDLDALYRDTGFECKADFKETILEVSDWVKNLAW